jgi:hypothetical protein
LEDEKAYAGFPHYARRLVAPVTADQSVILMSRDTPAYTIYDRDIPLPHLRAGCIISNPIGPPEDRRPAHEKTVSGCEGASCQLSPSRASEQALSIDTQDEVSHG